MMLTTIQKKLRHMWRLYGTMNNVVVVVALVIAASWAWGSVTVMQRNFALQRESDEQRRQLQLNELQVATLKYQQNYYKSDEYKDLAARMYLGLANPGEKVLILPPNSAAAKDDALSDTQKVSRPVEGSSVSNLDQWLNFLAGNNSASYLQN